MQIAIVNGKAFKYLDDNTLEPLADGVYEFKKNKQDLRTAQQNRALHQYFNMLSEALSSAGYDIPTVIKAGVSVTPYVVKEFMWKPVQKAILGKESTASLRKNEIDTVYNNLNRITGEKFGINIPFPSIEEMIFRENYKDAS